MYLAAVEVSRSIHRTNCIILRHCRYTIWIDGRNWNKSPFLFIVFSCMSGVTEVKSLEHFDACLSAASQGNKGACVFFWAEFHEPSKKGGHMDVVFTTLSDKYKDNLVFMKV